MTQTENTLVFLTCLWLYAYTGFVQAEAGDTVIVQTITYSTPIDNTVPGNPRTGIYLFPSDTIRFEKILMYYTLKCDPSQNPACGEWDSHSYTRVFDSAGIRYEIGRFITPYGFGITATMGDGFTWIYDVSDYMPLLSDSVYIEAGNWQELLDLKFVMIKGTPPRDVIRVENLWTGDTADYNPNFYYNANVETLLTEKIVNIDMNEKMARLKITNTGHGFGGNENCAEFCPKTHEIIVNGVDTLSQYLWRDDCGLNPLYPQGGTWVYDRANWCPGAEVETDNFELTPYITPGSSIALDYNLQPGYVWNGNGSQPYYTIESQLITYTDPNFTLDAAVEDIIAPNNRKYYKRYNPVCGNPIIKIKNTGTDTITKLDITYGSVGGQLQTYQWTGSLGFLETVEVTLDPACWQAWEGSGNVFLATVSNPNGGNDEYSYNNTMYSTYDISPQYDSTVVLWLQTNHAPNETSWILQDKQGDTLYQSSVMSANTLYKDTFALNPGCYSFKLYDSGCDGLKFFANIPPYGSGTAGYAQLRIYNEYGGMTNMNVLNPDFGCQTSQSFTVDTLPVVSLSLPFVSVCENDAGFALSGGIPTGGTYTGTGVTGNIFDPAVAGIGSHTITYTNGNCTTQNIEVVNCTGIDQSTDKGLVKVYPNPTPGLFTVDLPPASIIPVSVKAFSLLGNVVYHKELQKPEGNKITCDLSELTEGSYLLEIMANNQSYYMKVFIIK